ncbi:MAG: ribulose-phosphate 3-epimerase [Candidatus Omnitrophota bacterium]|jgi:ribulose-phosphate 3-epimerase
MNKITIAPSLLSADFAHLSDEIESVKSAGCDALHLDVMDGHFVPNITIGPFIVAAIRKTTDLHLDAHLMIESPWDYIESFANAGADNITVHIEACGSRLKETIDLIHSFGKSAGVSLKPDTDLDSLKPYLHSLELVLLMTVNPGFGGQAFMPEVLPKIATLSKIYDKVIQVDGGINKETAPLVIKEGANNIVAGSAVFGAKDRAEMILQLRRGHE